MRPLQERAERRPRQRARAVDLSWLQSPDHERPSFHLASGDGLRRRSRGQSPSHVYGTDGAVLVADEGTLHPLARAVGDDVLVAVGAEQAQRDGRLVRYLIARLLQLGSQLWLDLHV